MLNRQTMRNVLPYCSVAKDICGNVERLKKTIFKRKDSIHICYVSFELQDYCCRIVIFKLFFNIQGVQSRALCTANTACSVRNGTE